ncbi:MAG: 23S rRNA (pseudouridine(1915)-N(3))-methyltransferase RlmH [Bacteroidetes bacterium]|nr:23S rRNA (pseudouridine(1915)-N(3))-methyltransferase RlmH [Bacteroidota bacterium]
MKVEFWYIGKTNASYLQEGMDVYIKRLKHYLPFRELVIPNIKRNKKSTDTSLLKKREGEKILNALSSDDFLVILDEKGKSFSSKAFATFLDHKLQLSHRRLIFLVGGAFGFSQEIYQRANASLSLSAMTYSHQLIRLIFLEQLYRAMTILRNEPYHNA